MEGGGEEGSLLANARFRSKSKADRSTAPKRKAALAAMLGEMRARAQAHGFARGETLLVFCLGFIRSLKGTA